MECDSWGETPAPILGGPGKWRHRLLFLFTAQLDPWVGLKVVLSVQDGLVDGGGVASVLLLPHPAPRRLENHSRDSLSLSLLRFPSGILPHSFAA